MKGFIFFTGCLSLASAHSWMSCPPSFNPLSTRGGETTGPCESMVGTQVTTQVSALDRLKVGWPANNHGGGFVRISLVSEDYLHNANLETMFEQNVLKVACYGYDTRPGKFEYGDCNHPCNARGGCEYESSSSDVNRYDTTVAIPSNIQPGYYILQWAALVGNGGTYYSCARLQVKNSNVTSNCPNNGASALSKTPPCLKTAAGMAASTLLGDSSMGNFCFGSGVTDVDFNISTAPVNVNCDPRMTCALSVDQDTCSLEAPNIHDPLDPVSVCGNTTITNSATTTSTATTSTSTTVPTYDEDDEDSDGSNSCPPVDPYVYPTLPPFHNHPTRTSDCSSTYPSKTQMTVAPTNCVAGGQCSFSASKFFCSGTSLARCVYGKWVIQACPAGTQCRYDGNGGYCHSASS